MASSGAVAHHRSDQQPQEEVTIEKPQLSSELAAAAVEPERQSDPSHRPQTWGNWREYFGLVRWLVPHVVRHARGRILGVMILSVAGVGARAATAGSVLLYVRAQSKGTSVVLLGQPLPSDASLLAFSIWGGAALLFALLDVGVRSWADRINFRIAESYATTAMQDLLRHAAAGGSFDSPEDLALRNRDPIVAILQIDTQRLVRVVVQTLSLPLPMITFLLVAGVLVSINAALTTVLLPLVAGYSLAVAAINRRMLRDSQRRRLAMPELRRDLQDIAQTLAHTRYPNHAQPAWLTSFPRKSWMERSVRAYRGMWFARRRVQYLRDGFNGLALLLIVMLFGALLAGDATPWTSLLTYLVALGYGVQSMDKFSRLVTAANRQIPHIRRYVQFMQSNPESVALRRAQTQRGEDKAPGPHRLATHADALPESAVDGELAPGSPTFCCISCKLETGALPDVSLALAGGDPVAAMEIETQLFALAGLARLPERPFSRYLPRGSEPEAQFARVRSLLEQMGLFEQFDKEFGNLSSILSEPRDRRLSPGLRYALRLLPAILGGAKFAILGWSPLARLDPAERERILAALHEQIVLLVPDDPSSPLPEKAAQVIVVCGSSLRGIGNREWHEMLRREGHLLTPDWLVEARDATASRGSEELDDIDEDEDDE